MICSSLLSISLSKSNDSVSVKKQFNYYYFIGLNKSLALLSNNFFIIIVLPTPASPKNTEINPKLGGTLVVYCLNSYFY